METRNEKGYVASLQVEDRQDIGTFTPHDPIVKNEIGYYERLELL